KYDVVGEVRGQGLFAGVEFVQDKATKEPVTEGQMGQLMGNVLAQNVIVGRTNSSFHGLNNIMNFAPCLIITKEEVDTVVNAVETAIQKTFE
ncbi:MAG: aminotransferase class III-fold pyridoxal phosphate-dependent enzyme, partial [Desulfobacter sp.]